MIDRKTDEFESEIIAAFARGSSPVSNGGFTRRVMGRIQRRRLIRGCVLGVAWVGGGLLAGLAAAAITTDLAAGIRAVASGWSDAGWLTTYRTALFGVLGGAASVALARLIED